MHNHTKVLHFQMCIQRRHFISQVHPAMDSVALPYNVLSSLHNTSSGQANINKHFPHLSITLSTLMIIENCIKLKRSIQDQCFNMPTYQVLLFLQAIHKTGNSTLHLKRDRKLKNVWKTKDQRPESNTPFQSHRLKTSNQFRVKY